VLTVSFGEGQVGSARIELDGTLVNSGSEEVTADLGPATELQGRTVKVFSRINKTSPSPRFCVNYDWTGGVAPQQDVDEDLWNTPPTSAKVKATYTLT
jgi:hypothetical protein